MVMTRTEEKLNDEHSTKEEFQKVRDFVKHRPYGFETVYAFTTLIDTEETIKTDVFHRGISGTGIDEAEVHALDFLTEGNFYTSLGKCYWPWGIGHNHFVLWHRHEEYLVCGLFVRPITTL